MKHSWRQRYSTENGNYMKVNIRWQDLSAPSSNLTLRMLATGLTPFPPPSTGNSVIPHWENFLAQEGQNPAVLIRSSSTERPNLLPCLTLTMGLTLLNRRPRLPSDSQGKPPAWERPKWTKRNSEKIVAMKLVRKLASKPLSHKGKNVFKRNIQKKKVAYKLKRV